MKRNNVTSMGYRRFRVGGGKKRMEHDLVWEKHKGPIPKGMHVHHKNEDKLDNRIENLELLTPLEHKRLHLGCKFEDGLWWKKCPRCAETKKADHDYYPRSDGIDHICKVCRSAQSVKDKKIRRSRLREGS